MSKANKIYAYFRLSGVNLNPHEITTFVNIQPTQSWKTGDLDTSPRGRRMVRKFSAWKVESKLAPSGEPDLTRDVEMHVESVLEQLQPGWEALTKISSQYEALICCVVYAYSHMPAIHFNRQITRKVSELNASIDIDVYCLGGLDKEQCIDL